MEKKTLLVPFLAILAVLAVGIVSAGDLTSTSSIETEFNGMILASGTNYAGFTGDTVPVRVTFTANSNLTNDYASDVKVKVWMEGYRDDIEAETGRFNIIEGSVYTKLLSLKLPSDLKDTYKIFTLYVSISDADDKDEVEYTIRMQRESYEFEILSIDYNTQVSAGEVFPVAVVVNNNGFERMDDGYVVVSIPELGISARGYFGDLIATEICDECENEEDSMQKTVYLRIPENAQSGVYNVEVKAYNKEASVTETKLVSVKESGSTQVIAGVKTQDLKAGETKTYDLIIVNSADNVRVFNIQTVSGSALDIFAPSVVTVGAKSSITVPITVAASNDANVGAYTFTVNVDNQQVVFGANVTKGGNVSTSVVALTVVLVVIFVVLLIVLIVLLTRREKPMQEVETSYY